MEVATGQVVEFIEGQRFICALCLGRKGSRYHVLTHLGREANLAKGRFLHISPQRVKSSTRSDHLYELQAINARRDQLKNEVDVKDLWELLKDESGKWPIRELTDLAFGKEAGPDHEAGLIRAVIEDHTYFKFRDNMIVVQAPAAVEQLLNKRAQEEEKLRRLAKGSSWLERLWSSDARSCDQERDYTSDPDIKFWINAIKEYCVKSDDAQYGTEVKNLFRNAGLNNPSAPFETLVKAGIWDEDENLEILKFEISPEFPIEVEEEAKKLCSLPVEREHREDLTNLPTFTIDAAESLDLDDALSFREINSVLEVGIHITDIGLQVAPSTLLFEEAIKRATTIYMPDQKIPMLPEILSQGAWSLKAGSVRRALSFFAKFSPDGELLETQIKRTLIKVHDRLTYDEVDSKIKEEGKFSRFYQLCQQLEKKRIKSGALPLPIPELIIEITPEKRVRVYLNQPGPARFLVAESMILANFIAASFLRDHNLPALYRSQPEPRERIITGEEKDILANIRQRRRISRGTLDSEPGFHHGLGLDAYTTVTSPLRRGLDLLMQQQLTSFLLKGEPLHSKEALSHLAIHLKEGLSAAAAVRQARTRYWLLKHFEQNKGSELEGWILEIGPFKVLVILKDYLIPVELPRERGVDYMPDQIVKVKIKKVNARENILKFDWASVQP